MGTSTGPTTACWAARGRAVAADNGPVIADVDATLAAWLGGLVPDVRLSFAPPGGEPPAPGRSRSATAGKAEPPVLSVLLHAVREDPDGSLAGWDEVRDEHGVMVGRTPPPRRYRLTYLLVATATEPLAEHEVLGSVLVGAARDEVVPGAHLAGALAHADGPVLVRCAPPAGTADAQHLWASWGCPARLALELTVLAPMPTSFLLAAAPPPARVELHTAGRVVRRPPERPTGSRPAVTVHEHGSTREG